MTDISEMYILLDRGPLWHSMI